jgi:hypothetical protein
VRSGDPEAWQHRDRLWAERGTNPDLLIGPPETEVERRMQERRGYAFKLAADAWICGDDPAVGRSCGSSTGRSSSPDHGNSISDVRSLWALAARQRDHMFLANEQDGGDE